LYIDEHGVRFLFLTYILKRDAVKLMKRHCILSSNIDRIDDFQCGSLADFIHALRKVQANTLAFTVLSGWLTYQATVSGSSNLATLSLSQTVKGQLSLSFFLNFTL